MFVVHKPHALFHNRKTKVSLGIFATAAAFGLRHEAGCQLLGDVINKRLQRRQGCPDLSSDVCSCGWLCCLASCGGSQSLSAYAPQFRTCPCPEPCPCCRISLRMAYAKQKSHKSNCLPRSWQSDKKSTLTNCWHWTCQWRCQGLPWQLAGLANLALPCLLSPACLPAKQIGQGRGWASWGRLGSREDFISGFWLQTGAWCVLLYACCYMPLACILL